jgi:hypothetical protein
VTGCERGGAEEFGLEPIATTHGVRLGGGHEVDQRPTSRCAASPAQLSLVSAHERSAMMSEDGPGVVR